MEAGPGVTRRPRGAAGASRRWRRPALAGCAVVLLVLVLGLSPAPPARAEAGADIISRVAQLRQLSLEPVPVDHMTQDELRRILEESDEEDLAEMAVEQDLYLFLGFLEEGDNLSDIVVQAYAQEIVGFYDHEEARLCLVGDGAADHPMDAATLAHEYAHALQDQHFDLSAVRDQGDDSEASAAALALIEGDATMVTSLYIYQFMTEEERAAIGEFTAPGATPDIEMPPIVEQTMLFPYEYGIRFVLALMQEGGWEAVNQAYSDLPASTEQIMHPRKYFRHRDDPVEVALPDLAAVLGPGWYEADSGAFGEFCLKLFLQVLLDERQAGRAAEGWGGDRYSFLKDSSGSEAFVLSTAWDDADEARQFYDSCVDWCAELGGTGRRGSANGNHTSGEWESDGRSSRFVLDGTSVYLVMASEAGSAGRAMSAIYHRPSRVWIWALMGAGVFCVTCALIAAEVMARRRRCRRAQNESGPE